MMYQVKFSVALPDGTVEHKPMFYNFNGEAEAEKVAIAFLGAETARGTIVSSQVWSTGTDASMLNEFEA